jgi:hypothetical protein
MIFRFYVAVFALCVFGFPMRAYALSEQIVQSDYEKCVDGQHDVLRVSYCECIRDGERKWSIEDYGQVALQSLAGSQPAPLLEALSKGCFDKVSSH